MNDGASADYRVAGVALFMRCGSPRLSFGQLLQRVGSPPALDLLMNHHNLAYGTGGQNFLLRIVSTFILTLSFRVLVQMAGVEPATFDTLPLSYICIMSDYFYEEPL